LGVTPTADTMKFEQLFDHLDLVEGDNGTNAVIGKASMRSVVCLRC